MRKKLLFINGHLNVGGVERSLVDLLNWIDYSKYDIDLLLLENKGDYSSELSPNVNVIFRDTRNVYGSLLPTLVRNLKNRKFSDVYFRVVLALSAFCGKRFLKLLTPVLRLWKNYDCAIAYRPGVCTDLLAYAVRSRKKISWWHHGECNYDDNAIKETNKTWKHIDRLVTVSNGCKDMLGKIFSFPLDKITVIPNMVDVDKIIKMAGCVSPYQENENIVNIVTVGTLTKEKHVIDIIDVVKILQERGHRNFKWHIVGDGILQNEICDKIKCEKLSKCIIMHGKKVNPYPYMKYANLLVHLSHVESQCITVLEAMALRTFCIVCKSIGTNETIENGINGILTNWDVRDISKTIELVMTNKKSVKTIENTAYRTIVKQFSPDPIEGKFRQLLSSI